MRTLSRGSVPHLLVAPDAKNRYLSAFNVADWPASGWATRSTMTPPPPKPSLTQILDRYESLSSRGENATPEDLCRECPELLEAVRGEVAALERMKKFMHNAESKGGAAQPVSIGRVLLQRYEITRLLGRGAFGEVVEVRDVPSGAYYALKRLPRDKLWDKALLRQMYENFELVRNLHHPNIAMMHGLEAEPEDGNVCMIMELVRGEPMDGWIEKQRQRLGGGPQPLPLPLALTLCEQIASALDFAHVSVAGPGRVRQTRAIGILHRDLKPANVMVSRDHEFRPGVPYVKLVDYGMAAEAQASLQERSLTGVQNRLAGTPYYMAPEQWEGRTLTRGVDQWALAVILYELIAGRRPFEGPTELAIMDNINRANPEPIPQLPPAQWAALKQAFARDRRQRYRSCLALVRAIADADPMTRGLVLTSERILPDEFRDPHPNTSTPRPGPYGQPAAPQPSSANGILIGGLAALGVVLLVGVVSLVVYLAKNPSPNPPAPPSPYVPAPPLPPVLPPVPGPPGPGPGPTPNPQADNLDDAFAEALAMTDWQARNERFVALTNQGSYKAAAMLIDLCAWDSTQHIDLNALKAWKFSQSRFGDKTLEQIYGWMELHYLFGRYDMQSNDRRNQLIAARARLDHMNVSNPSILASLANAWSNTDPTDLNRATRYSQSVLETIKAEPSPFDADVRAWRLLLQGDCCLTTLNTSGNVGTATSYYLKAAEAFKALRDFQAVGLALDTAGKNNIPGNVKGYAGDFDRAKEYFEGAIEARRLCNDPLLGNSIYNLGRNYLALGYTKTNNYAPEDFNAAAKEFEEAAKLFRINNNDYMLAHALNCQGEVLSPVHVGGSDWKTPTSLLEEAARLALQLRDNELILATYRNLSYVLDNKNNPDKNYPRAVQLLEQAADYAQKLNWTDDQAKVLSDAGDDASVEGDPSLNWDRAAILYKKASDIRRQWNTNDADSQNTVAWTYYRVGYCMSHGSPNSMTPEARGYFQQAYSLYQRANNQAGMNNCQNFLRSRSVQPTPRH